MNTESSSVSSKGTVKALTLQNEHETQEDSFLTAARMLRGGWSDNAWKMSNRFNHNEPLQSVSAKDKTLAAKHQATKQTELQTKQQIHCDEKMADSIISDSDKGKQADVDAPSVDAMNETETFNAQNSVVYVWRSGCRSSSRGFRRFKAPFLPVIAEMEAQ